MNTIKFLRNHNYTYYSDARWRRYAMTYFLNWTKLPYSACESTELCFVVRRLHTRALVILMTHVFYFRSVLIFFFFNLLHGYLVEQYYIRLQRISLLRIREQFNGLEYWFTIYIIFGLLTDIGSDINSPYTLFLDFLQIFW